MRLNIFFEIKTLSFSNIKNLNPIWNEEFTIEYDNKDYSALKIQVSSQEGLSHDFMGYKVLSIREIIENNGVDKWLRLHTNTKHSEVSGFIHVIAKIEN